MVVFNKLKNTLIYSVVKYNYIFLEYFLIYIMIEQMSMTIFNYSKGSDYLFCIDSKLQKINVNWTRSFHNFYIDRTNIIKEFLTSSSKKPLTVVELYKIYLN